MPGSVTAVRKPRRATPTRRPFNSPTTHAKRLAKCACYQELSQPNAEDSDAELGMQKAPRKSKRSSGDSSGAAHSESESDEDEADGGGAQGRFLRPRVQLGVLLLVVLVLPMVLMGALPRQGSAAEQLVLEHVHRHQKARPKDDDDRSRHQRARSPPSPAPLPSSVLTRAQQAQPFHEDTPIRSAVASVTFPSPQRQPLTSAADAARGFFDT
eukprot:5577071-Prymnesium_polylepis.1